MSGRLVSRSTVANLSAFGAGLVFAIGLTISGMTHPRKIVGFLDPRASGGWDPSLAFVMVGALVVAAAAFPLILRRSRPLLASRFALTTKREIEPRLVVGAALFGLGWGLGGFCPGPAVVVLVTGALPVLVFVASMLAGMALFDVYRPVAGAEKTSESVGNRS
jgi:uncharacterized protein